MDGSGRSDEKDSIKVGDIEKEKEIERRLRELGLWENKRLLESRVASMLDAHIDEQDVLSRTLRKCRRRRAGAEDGGSGGGGGKTAVEEIRNIISPSVIRDCYGQKIAYQVNILMGCFTKNIEHEVINDVIVIRGSTTVNDDDPKRLTKELRLELPASLNMAAMQLSYAAGAVKIRVPYLIELPPSLKRSLGSSDEVRSPTQRTSISPIYSLNMSLNKTKQGSIGADSLSSDSPNSATSLLSPLMPSAMSDSPLTDSIDLQPRGSPSLDSPAATLPSPFPVFEDDTRVARGNTSETLQDLERRTNESSFGGSVGVAPTISEGVRSNGFRFVSEAMPTGITPRVAHDSDEVFHKQSISQEDSLRRPEDFKTNNFIGQRISEKHGRTLVEEYRNGGLDPSDSKSLSDAISKRTQTRSDETVDRLGNNLRNRAVGVNMAAIYVNIPDNSDIGVADDLDGSTAISKEFREPTQLTSCEERTSNYSPDHLKWSSSDHSKPDSLGNKGDSRWQDEGTISVHVLNDEENSTKTDPKWKKWKKLTGDAAETKHREAIDDDEGVQKTGSNTSSSRRSTLSAERTLDPLKEFDEDLVNGRRENATKIGYDAKNNRHYGDSSAKDLHDRSYDRDKDTSETTYRAAYHQNDHEKQTSFTHPDNAKATRSEGIPTLEKGPMHKKTYSSVQPLDDNYSLSTTHEKAAGHDESCKVASEDTLSDSVPVISSNGGYDKTKTVTLKQNGETEEKRGEAGFRSVTEDSYRAGTISEGKMSPIRKKPLKILDYLLDSLDETIL